MEQSWEAVAPALGQRVPADRRRGRDQPPDRCAAPELDLGRHRLPDVRQSALAAHLDVGERRARREHRLFAHRGRQRAGPRRRATTPAARRPNSLDLLATYSRLSATANGSAPNDVPANGTVSRGPTCADRLPADACGRRRPRMSGQPIPLRHPVRRHRAVRKLATSAVRRRRLRREHRHLDHHRPGPVVAGAGPPAQRAGAPGGRARSSSSSRSWSTSTTAPAAIWPHPRTRTRRSSWCRR